MMQPSARAIENDSPERLQQQAVNLVAYWIGRARELLRVSAWQLPVPSVAFDLRGRAAGQAVFARRSRDCRIRINAALLASHPHAMLAETVPHEVVHVVIYRLYGRQAKPHGAEWQALMRAFGLDPAPCHNLPAEPSRQLQRYRYVCACDEPAWLTSIRHKRVLRGTEYVCRRCGQKLARAG